MDVVCVVIDYSHLTAMYPTSSSIVHVKDVRMPADNAGEGKNFPMVRITMQTSAPLNDAGVKIIRTTDSTIQ